MRRIVRYLSIGTVLVPSVSHAVSLDYYTYNGFDQTVAAFQRLALIFGDNEYLYLIATAIILGIVFAALATGARHLSNNAQGNSLTWVFMVLFGVVIFKGTVLPKGTIHIYDPVRNDYLAVGGVPDLVVFVAGAVNKAERVVVDLVDASSAYPYKDSAGGINFQMLLNAMTDQTGGFEDVYLTKSIKRYYSDCSQMALIQNSYNFDLNQLRSGTSSLYTLLQELRSPADFTRWYDTSNKGGLTQSCSDAWDNKIMPALVDVNNYAPMLNTVCSKSGFNVAVPLQLARCQTLLGAQNLSVYNTSGDHIHFLRNATLATAISSALLDANPDVGLRALTNRSVLTEGIGIAQTANEWLPTVRATVTAIILGLIPLLVVFMVTPLLPKALTAMLGLFAWLTFWGIADVVMHRGAMDQAFAAVEEIQRHNMGLTAMMLTPEVATKALSIFGQARSMGATIASLLAAILVGFSGYALSQVAGTFQNSIEKAGGDAAEKSITPEGSGRSLLANAEGYGASLNVSSMGFDSFASASAMTSGAPLSSAAQYLNQTSSSGMSTASAIASKGAVSAGNDYGSMRAMQGAAAKNGGDPNSVADLFSAASDVSNLEQAGRAGDARGKSAAISELGFGSADDFNEVVSGVQTLMSGTDSMTHSANTERFKDLHYQRTGEELSDEQAATQYSQVRLAAITGDVNAFESGNAAVEYMTNNRHLQDHHLAGRMAAAHQLGVKPSDLAEAGGQMQSAMESADMDQLASMSVRDVALGTASNRIMSTQDGLGLQQVLQDEGFMSGTAQLAKSENALRYANSEQIEALADNMGVSVEDLAMLQSGASRNISYGESNVGAMIDSGMITEQQAAITPAGVATVSLGAEGETVSSQVQSNSSASVDQSRSVNTGFSAGGSSGASSLLMNTENEERLEQVLKATDNDPVALDALKMDMIGYISQIQSSETSNTDGYQLSASLGLKVPGALTALAPINGSAGGSASQGATDSTSYSANYQIIDKAFSESRYNAKVDTNFQAQDRSDLGNPMSDEERQSAFFDNYASQLNGSLGALVGQMKDDGAAKTDDHLQSIEKYDEADLSSRSGKIIRD